MVFGHLGGRLAERWSERKILAIGLGMCSAGAAGLLAAAVLHLPLTAVILSLSAMILARRLYLGMPVESLGMSRPRKSSVVSPG